MNSRTIKFAALVGASAVLLGAFGAHALENRLDQRGLEIWHTANRYHFYHASAILGLALWQKLGGRGGQLSLLFWSIGLAIFSGGLYLYALTGLKVAAMIVPIGGLSFTIGWLALFKLDAPNP